MGTGKGEEAETREVFGDAMLGWGIAMEMQEKPAEAEHAYMRGLEVDEGRREQQPAIRRQATAGTQNQFHRLVSRVGEAGTGQNSEGGIMDKVEFVFAKQRQTATDRGEHSS